MCRSLTSVRCTTRACEVVRSTTPDITRRGSTHCLPPRERQLPARYVEFDYAGHGFIRPDHRRTIFAAVADHFRVHMASRNP